MPHRCGCLSSLPKRQQTRPTFVTNFGVVVRRSSSHELQTVVCDFQNKSWIYHAVGWLQVAMAMNRGSMKKRHAWKYRYFENGGFKQGGGVGVGRFWVESESHFFIRLWESNWIIFYIALLSYEPLLVLLKWYNLLWRFYWNREFLLCAAISIDC